jgi:hypothetical protein
MHDTVIFICIFKFFRQNLTSNPSHLDLTSSFILRQYFQTRPSNNISSIMKLVGILLAICGPLAVFASNVLELDESNFDQYVGAGKPPALVELYVIQMMPR